jgi:hypothetical protein
MVSVVLYGLICSSFLEYPLNGFRSLSIGSQSYIFIFEITIIPMPFLFPIVSYHFRFSMIKCKSESDGAFHRCFRAFSSLNPNQRGLYCNSWYVRNVHLHTVPCMTEGLEIKKHGMTWS